MYSPYIRAASVFYPFFPMGGFGLFNGSCEVCIESFVLGMRWVFGKTSPFVVFGAHLVSADTEGRKILSPPSFHMRCSFDRRGHFSCSSIDRLKHLVSCLFEVFDCVNGVLQCRRLLGDFILQLVVVFIPVHSFVVEMFSMLAQEVHEVDDRYDR